MRDNRSLFLEKRIPAGVIKVVVSVHDEQEWFVGDALQSGLNFFCQGSELVVNNDNPILADGSSDVAARALQHVNVARDFRNFHLDFAEVLILPADKHADT